MGFRIEIKLVLSILFFLLTGVGIFITYSCTHSSDDCKDIGVLKFLDTATVKGKEYSLLMRQTGFQDKIQFLLLYENNVLLDSCGNPIGDELAHEPIDYGPEGGPIIQWPEKFEIKNKQIFIQYTKLANKRKNIVDIPVIWYQNETQ